MTEQQKFEVIEEHNGFEIREFLPCVVSDVLTTGDISSAGSEAFRPLFNYISSNNISMTAPVLNEEVIPNQWKVSFVMPADARLEDLPNPTGSPVTLREIPAQRAAVLRFSGRTTPQSALEYEGKLRELLNAQGITPTGKARIARFDPPWKPPFARHNEVIIPID
jgi:effector-binding domain-containing protein